METKDFDKQTWENFKANRYSRTEYRRVKRWFARNDPGELQKAMEGHWNVLPAAQPLNERLIDVLETIKRQLGFSKRSKRQFVFDFYRKVAAILFIPLLLGFGYWFFHFMEIQPQQSFASIHSPEGARTEFTLPDGTTGWLNNGSVLTYPVEFVSDRTVTIEGEAYFDVVHQKSEPFLVKTRELIVQVLGTSFSVAAYRDDPEISVVLKEGKVQINGLDGKGGYVLNPDEKFQYNVDHKRGIVSRIDASAQVAWTTGLLSFKGESLQGVMKKLARWYNVDYEIRDGQLQNYSFTATFKDEPLDEILRMIALTTPMKYQIEERKKDVNGLYMKRKVTIKKE